ncbi:DnaJ domain-containing protein [Phascolomyces articulosus]|uniref:DnaJ domain-containing protein n=1 Tax=Phascolomyces articulosus TaxID=60185 RepID=A0AAD5JZB2_9FUNG|nr:DnaJ domain-containing protein [Phascolomyces articulosus]
MFRRLYATAAAAKKRKDPFEILSLGKNASSQDIKKRYYELAKTLHPDNKETGGNVEEFHQVVKAYEFLQDPVRRRNYIQTGYGWNDVLLQQSHQDPWGGGTTTPGQRSAAYTNAYWASHDDIHYKGGPWSSHDKPRFMKNTVFISVVAALSVTFGILQFVNILDSHSSLRVVANQHHLRTSEDLKKARTEAQLFGNQRAVERMLEHRMKYFRPEQDEDQNKK